jgi:hypothetical protein
MAISSLMTVTCFSDTLLVFVSWLQHTSKMANCYPEVQVSALGVALFPTHIIRARTPILPLTCSENLSVFLKCGGRLCSARFWQHLSIILCCVLKQELLCWHTLAIWEHDCWQSCSHCCLCLPTTPVLKQFRAGRF